MTQARQERRLISQAFTTFTNIEVDDLIQNPSLEQQALLRRIQELKERVPYTENEEGTITFHEGNLSEEELLLLQEAVQRAGTIRAETDQFTASLRESKDEIISVTIQRIEAMTHARVAEILKALKTELDLGRELEISRHETTLATSASLTDALTGLPNRRSLELILTRTVLACLEQNSPINIMFVDGDHFKQANDQLGHNGGDVVLRTLAQTMQASVMRETDLLHKGRGQKAVGRFGGEEFIVVLPATDKAGAHVVASRIQDNVNGLDEFKNAATGNTYKASVSIGIASMTPEKLRTIQEDMPEATPQEIAGKIVTQLLAEADGVVYVVKADGRNGIQHADDHTPEQVASAKEQLKSAAR